MRSGKLGNVLCASVAALGLNKQEFILCVETESRLLVAQVLGRSGDKLNMFFCGVE